MSAAAAERSACAPGCRCRCGQQGCGCHEPVTTSVDCSLRRGVRCAMCFGQAYAQRVESQLRGRPIVLIWCPKCDVPSDPTKAKA